MTQFSHRSPSADLVELHVFIVPPSLWLEKYRTAYNNVVLESFSAGFIRVSPTIHMDELRHDIYDQLGKEDLPESFMFLRSVGRCMALVNRKQELKLQAKHFLPPMAYSPELFLLPGTNPSPEIKGDSSGDAVSSSKGEFPTAYSSYSSDTVPGNESVISSPTHALSSSNEHSEFNTQEYSGKGEDDEATEDDPSPPRGSLSPRDSSEMLSLEFERKKDTRNKLERIKDLKTRRSNLQLMKNGTTALPEIDTKNTSIVCSPRRLPSSPKPLISPRDDPASPLGQESMDNEIAEEADQSHFTDEDNHSDSNYKDSTSSDNVVDENERKARTESHYDDENYRDEVADQYHEEEENQQQQQQQQQQQCQEQQQQQHQLQQEEETQQSKASEYEAKLKQVEDEKYLKRLEEERRRGNLREAEGKRRKELEQESEEKINELERLIRMKHKMKAKQKEAERQLVEEMESAKHDTMQRIRELKTKIDSVEDDKSELQNQREDILKSIKKLNHEEKQVKTAEGSAWRKKYLDEKRQAKALEEQLYGVKRSLDEKHKRMIDSMNGKTTLNSKKSSTVKDKSPSLLANEKMTLQRLKRDNDDLVSRVEMTKVKLQAETKLRSDAQDRLRQLRLKVVDQKISRHRSKSPQQRTPRT